MKTKLFIVASVILGGITMLSLQSKPTHSANLTVTVLLDDAPVGEALVGLSDSEENLENSVYLFEGETNSKGTIVFTGLHEGTYYLDASSGNYYGEAKVIVGHENATVTMELDEE